MGLKDTTSDWDTKENLVRVCLHLLSVYLLHLSSFFLFPSLYGYFPAPHKITQHCAIAQREKETDFLFPISPDVSYFLSFSPTSLFQNSQDKNCSVCIRYLHQH